jgi:hypothetical protein
VVRLVAGTVRFPPTLAHSAPPRRCAGPVPRPARPPAMPRCLREAGRACCFRGQPRPAAAYAQRSGPGEYDRSGFLPRPFLGRNSRASRRNVRQHRSDALAGTWRAMGAAVVNAGDFRRTDHPPAVVPNDHFGRGDQPPGHDVRCLLRQPRKSRLKAAHDNKVGTRCNPSPKWKSGTETGQRVSFVQITKRPVRV